MVRSGSALLEQLRRVTPQGVRLVSVDANSSKLLIQGESQGPNAFERINALNLSLEALSGMLPVDTTVVKAVAEQQGRIAFTSRPSRPAMQLTLKLSFYDLAPMSDVPSNGSHSSPS